MNTSPTLRFDRFLRKSGLLGATEQALYEPLTGGVSSDIWLVRTDTLTLCLKAALARLNVKQDWYVPVDRNAYEAAWLRMAGEIIPRAVPKILAEDSSDGLFAMTYFPPDTHLNWKTTLADGTTDPAFACAVGTAIARIHSETTNDPAVERQFATDAIFHAIRLEPYLEATATRHPDLASVLFNLSRTCAHTRLALIHGDVSPKNILVGPDGPVFLDAECACYGDPAFDLAFCLNHLLLKCLWKPPYSRGYIACYTALIDGYRSVLPDRFSDINGRAARLLPGLMLGRIDGRSPVEYLTDGNHKELVRTVAANLLLSAPSGLDKVLATWCEQTGV